MQDNDTKHTSSIVVDYLDEIEVNLLEWPPQSPGLNPIEHIWAYIKRKVTVFGKLNKKELKERILEIWHSIDVNMLQNFFNSFHKRALEVYKAKGKHTHC
ncbi:TCB1 [Hepatospora eriocheir]|uniref:TCB1 n=1 Tax=Hepatospora eriocheir TaxID=1081669 RepID=A0A1X0QIT7_9MICR|nr:TCB1 [Hepatospora eriocheir]